MVHFVITTPAAPDTCTVEIVADLRKSAETTGWVQDGQWLFGPRPVTNHLENLWTIRGLSCTPEKPVHVMWLTSANWAELAGEMFAKYGKKPTPGSFQHLILGKVLQLHIRNSGTEDQGVVNEMNRLSASDAEFAAKRDHFKRARRDP